MGFSGLDGVRHRLRAEAVRSCRALPAALGPVEKRDRGVKNLLDFRGVMDGFRLSLLRLAGSLGGDERRSLVSMAELLAAVVDFSVMVSPALTSYRGGLLRNKLLYQEGRKHDRGRPPSATWKRDTERQWRGNGFVARPAWRASRRGLWTRPSLLALSDELTAIGASDWTGSPPNGARCWGTGALRFLAPLPLIAYR